MVEQADTKQGDVEPLVTIEGQLERIVYENAESGFFVGRVAVEGQPDPVTCVGNLMAVSEGETIRLKGRWVEDRKFGRQLRVESYQTILPNTAEGIERYLGSGLVPGIGPAYAKRLVAAFGVETLRVIEETPERLRKVSGIGPKRAAGIREAWSEHKAIQSIMIFLQGHGITASQAVKIYRAYGDGAVTVLRENPFRLARDIAGISFHGADKIAARLGMAQDAPERLRAGVVHVLTTSGGNGHVYLLEPDLLDGAAELLGAPAEALDDALAALVKSKELVREGDALFLPGMHAAERGCAKLLKRLVASPLEAVPIHIEKALAWVEKQHKITLAPQQREAVTIGIEKKVMVITGGPGTGKTTIINSLLGILEKKSLSFLLAAPTGRAAKRMEAATDCEARTIHRLLEYSPKIHAFQRNESNPLKTDLIVIDEASMIDAQLMHSLLQAAPPFARLILVGDVDQLPSVGAGNVLLDIIASGIVPVVRLDTVFRQAEGSGIVANAHKINTGQFPAFNQNDFFLIEREEPAKALETVVELVANRIPKKFGLDPFRDIQVLSPMRRGDAGVVRLNEALQAALNPDGRAVPRRNFRHGDKVMQLRNNYDLDVYNGDVGRVSLVDEEAKEIEVAFDDERRVLYGLGDLDNLDLAYAATVHKSQGSEYPAVVIPFLAQHYMMLQRNVLYTGVTRGKKLVILVGQPKAIAMAVRNNRIAQRNTRLSDRLRGAL